jgi:hypothetical protein
MSSILVVWRGASRAAAPRAPSAARAPVSWLRRAPLASGATATAAMAHVFAATPTSMLAP